MRIASFARWDDARVRRDQDEDGLARRPRRRSVQRDEAVGAVDHVGQHHQAAVGDASARDSGRRRFWQP